MVNSFAICQNIFQDAFILNNLDISLEGLTELAIFVYLYKSAVFIASTAIILA